MRIIKNNGKIPEVKGKYMLGCHVKSIDRTAYAEVTFKNAFWGILYKFGIIKWGNAKENRTS